MSGILVTQRAFHYRINTVTFKIIAKFCLKWLCLVHPLALMMCEEEEIPSPWKLCFGRFCGSAEDCRRDGDAALVAAAWRCPARPAPGAGAPRTLCVERRGQGRLLPRRAAVPGTSCSGSSCAWQRSALPGRRVCGHRRSLQTPCYSKHTCQRCTSLL